MITATNLLTALVCALLGYIAGRLDLLLTSGVVTQSKPQSFFAKTSRESESKQQVSRVAAPDIDTSVYVGAVSTDNLVKSNNATIGKTSVTTDNINQSVSKLSQLKGK